MGPYRILSKSKITELNEKSIPKKLNLLFISFKFEP